MRIPCPPLKAGNFACGSLFFSDGSQKCLAAFIVWIALLLASEKPSLVEADFTHPQVVNLVASLLRIQTFWKASVGQGDELDNVISRIVKQNCDARIQPVSSLTWAAILSTMGESITLDQAINRYNEHPEAQAFEAEGGTGSISLDGRKKQACFRFSAKLLNGLNVHLRVLTIEFQDILSGAPFWGQRGPFWVCFGASL